MSGLLAQGDYVLLEPLRFGGLRLGFAAEVGLLPPERLCFGLRRLDRVEGLPGVADIVLTLPRQVGQLRLSLLFVGLEAFEEGLQVALLFLRACQIAGEGAELFAEGLLLLLHGAEAFPARFDGPLGLGAVVTDLFGFALEARALGVQVFAVLADGSLLDAGEAEFVAQFDQARFGRLQAAAHLAAAAGQLVNARRGCVAVGTNCGQGIQTMVPLVGELVELTELPLIVQPNAGMPKLVQGQTVYPEEPSVFSRYLPGLYDAGARIIGGCCGTTPQHIRVIRQFADSL